MSEFVKYEVQGRVGIITLNRPDARNAINGDVAKGVESAIDRLEEDDDVWVGILTANTEGQERPVFCAGADLKAINARHAAKYFGLGKITQEQLEDVAQRKGENAADIERWYSSILV